jgi:ABC-type amino acid transport system permease subunit
MLVFTVYLWIERNTPVIRLTYLLVLGIPLTIVSYPSVKE